MPSTVTIEKLVYGGDGLARVDGQVMLAPYVLPGERVAIETARVKAGLLRGTSAQVLEPSAHRIPARCEYFGHCGGCQYQHADYEYQVEQKVAILRETLRRLGGITFDREIFTVTGHPWSYRNRVQLHLADGRAGFYKQGSHDLCAVTHCEIAAPLLVEAISLLPKAVKQPEWPAFLRSFELFTNGRELQLNVLDSARPLAARFFSWCASFLPALVPGAITHEAGGFVFRISGGSFFQVNRFLVDDLIREVLDDSTGAHAVDLYAGVGLFSLPLAERFGSVDAVERGGSAYRDLEFNLREWPGVRTLRDSAEAFLETSCVPQPDLLVADPPRAGLGTRTVDSILRLAPKRVTLVSCDPATLARDARKLLESYRIRRLALVDLFPQTYHFETIMHLEAAR
jgi:23S rRNA (uracil1939-C5)-methyltransferase